MARELRSQEEEEELRNTKRKRVKNDLNTGRLIIPTTKKERVQQGETINALFYPRGEKKPPKPPDGKAHLITWPSIQCARGGIQLLQNGDHSKAKLKDEPVSNGTRAPRPGHLQEGEADLKLLLSTQKQRAGTPSLKKLRRGSPPWPERDDPAI